MTVLAINLKVGNAPAVPQHRGEWTLPIEHTNDATATCGPIQGSQILASSGWSVTNG